MPRWPDSDAASDDESCNRGSNNQVSRRNNNGDIFKVSETQIARRSEPRAHLKVVGPKAIVEIKAADDSPIWDRVLSIADRVSRGK
jgi:hypothetical protein